MQKLVKILIAISFVSFLGIGALSAQSKEEFGKQMARIRELFDNDMFVATEKEADAFISRYPDMPGLEKSEVEAYRVFSAIMLKNPNIDPLVMEFENTYPFSPQIALIRFYQSKYYFDKGEYSRSLDIINSIANRNLPKDERMEYIFNRAYCNMRVGDNDGAISGFEKILSFKTNPFTPSARYYLAYMLYLNKEFDKAAPLFSKLVNTGDYSVYSRYFLLESKLMLKDYEYVVKEGDAVYNVVEDDLKGKTARILSEAYFAADKPDEAKRYFEMYSGSGVNLSEKDNYYLGVVSYSLHSYLAAIDAFSKMASQNDSLGQSSYYHMGNAYLQLKNKRAAMDMFKNASQCEFDRTITEEAFFQYAKLLFDLNSDISAFEDYLKKYPSSGKSDEIYNYIATSYLLNKNYNSAISALNEISYLTPNMRMNLQKASFFRAMQLYESGSYNSAISHFKTSIKNGEYNNSLTLLSQFWMAETYFRANRFDEAVRINLNLVNNSRFRSSYEYPLAMFNLGYAYFRKYDFDNAILWFDKYLGAGPSGRSFVREAKARLADSYYMLRDYGRAAGLYGEIISETRTSDIYAAYQGAMSYGLLSNNGKKIKILEEILDGRSESSLYPMAVFELGRTYVQSENTDKAEKCFNLLLDNVKDSLYFSRSLLELGMIYSNKGQYDQALGYFKKVVEEAPMSEDSRSALAAMESIYQIMNRPDEYLAYLEKLGMSEIKTADERETMLFNSAEQIFLSERYPQAYNALTSFIEKYPSGAKAAQAYFYLGRTLLSMEKKEAAADAFRKVMDVGDGSFAELSTLYYAKISYDLENYDDAILAFTSLSDIAVLENNKTESLLGLMRSYYRSAQYDKAVAWAEKVLASEKGRSENELEAKYIKAKSLLALGKRDEAIPVLKGLSKDNMTAEGAEAAYLLIQDSYDEGDFQSVENQVYAFSESNTPQAYWLAKSFIVLGDSFADRDEWEQANATFQSIKDGYAPAGKHDDVLEQVEMRFKRMKSETQNR